MLRARGRTLTHPLGSLGWLLLAPLAGCVVAPPGEDPTPAGPSFGEPLGLSLPRVALTAEELGVIVNTDDPLSGPIAEMWMQARGVPAANRLELSLGMEATLSREGFVDVQAAVEAGFGPEIQGLVLTSMRPARVDCMGASAAFGLGFDPAFCQSGAGCQGTATVDTFDSPSTRPFTDHGVRPTMILAAETLAEAEALIARGVAADGTLPDGRGVFVRTTDAARSTRWPAMAAVVASWGEVLDLEYIDNSAGEGSDVVSGEEGLLFYLTGLAQVPDIATNSYRPGALADHLTSFGGQLPTSSQMSALAWLQAGATASYGTAVEPCNFTSKFPDPGVLVPRYLSGATALEAYWSSVWMPGEGNFVGEPLARPFGGASTSYEAGLWTIVTTNLVPGQRYQLQVAMDPDGPWEEVFRVEPEELGFRRIEVPDPVVGWYRFEED